MSSHFLIAFEQKNKKFYYEFYFYPFKESSYIVSIQSNSENTNLIKAFVSFYGYKTEYTK